jgi:hypothetical protein
MQQSPFDRNDFRLSLIHARGSRVDQPFGGVIVRLRTGLVGLLAFVLAVSVSCTADKPARSTATPAATTTVDHSGHAAEPAPTASGPLPLQFDQLLGQHAFVTVQLMRGMVSAEPDARQAAGSALQANTEALSQLVATSYGTADGDSFRQLWQRRIADLSLYADSVSNGDAAGKQTAQNALISDSRNYGAWLADASGNRVKSSAAAATARQHVQGLMQQVDAYHVKDYARAYALERQVYEQIFSSGSSLAKGSVDAKAAAAFDAPAEKLREAFAMLLGEHMTMLIETQRATFNGAQEFQAASAQVNANTNTIAKAMESIVGPKAAAEFKSAWANHIDGLVAYTAAVAGNDASKQSSAEKELNQVAVDLAVYFSHVVKNQSAVVPLTSAITSHDRHLMDHVDAYAERDFGAAQQMELDGYQQMLGISDTLVSAIQRVVKPGLPVGGSQTGGGGTAPQR